MAESNASGSRSEAMSLNGRDQEAALELAGAVEVEHRTRSAPAAGCDARSGQGSPDVLLAVVEMLNRDPPELALEDAEAPLLLRAHRQHAALHAHPAPASAAHWADNDRAAAVDVAVEQRMQRDNRIVVLGGGVHEVDNEAGLLARVAAGDAPDALLVDALGSRRREVHADGSPRAVPALGEQLGIDQHVDVAALVAGQDLGQLALGGLAGDALGLDALGAKRLGEVVGVAHARRIHDARHTVEARAIEVGHSQVERLLVEQFGELVLVELGVHLASAQRDLGDRAHAHAR